MDENLYHIIATSSAYLTSRKKTGAFIMNEPGHMPGLVAVALDIDDKHHYRAFMMLDYVLERNIVWLQPFLDEFCAILPHLTHESALRTSSRICMMAVNHHLNMKDFISEVHLRQIAEQCFDWMINDTKVAVKAQAMRTLFAIGTLEDWIHPEVVEIIQNQFAGQSAGYQAAAKSVLKNIKSVARK